VAPFYQDPPLRCAAWRTNARMTARGRSSVEACPLAASSQPLHPQHVRATRSDGKGGWPAWTMISPPQSGPTSSPPGEGVPIAEQRARPCSVTASCRSLVVAGTPLRTWFRPARPATRANTTTKSRDGSAASSSTSARSYSGTRQSCRLFYLPTDRITYALARLTDPAHLVEPRDAASTARMRRVVQPLGK